MKLRHYLSLCIPALAAFSSPVLAQLPVEQIRLGTPSYAGTGCPLGTASATLSPDAQSLSILFGAFQAQAGGSSGNTVDRKACNIAIPVTVPQGYTVSIIKIDYRGYNRLPLNASATFDVESFFAGQNGPSFHKSMVGATDGNFTLNNQLVATSMVWSACGADVNLRTNTSIAVQTNQFNEQAIMTLDSADITSGVVYQLQWKRCNAGPAPTPYPPAPTPYQPAPTPYNPYPNPTPYNPYPNPTPYNPYPNPTPYNPYPQPTPYNPYPPVPALGPCIINSYTGTNGILYYMVKDGTGRILGSSVMYAQAISIATQSQQQGFCSGIVNNASPPGQTNPYPAPPIPNPTPYNPYPNPAPYPTQSSCQIMNGGNAYGQRFYRVINRSGAILLNTADYNQALNFTRSDPRCFQ